MGLTLYNLITSLDDSSKDIQQEISNLKSKNPCIMTKTFKKPFNGIVAQVDMDRLYDYFEKQESSNQNNNDPIDYAFDVIDDLEKSLFVLSKEYENNIFLFINVDCQGGFCMNEGYAMINGEIVMQTNANKEAHVGLLQLLDQRYKGPDFYPFTRMFLNKDSNI